MEKSNFKKMALMGMLGGVLLASQSPMNNDDLGTEGTFLAGGCGANGCGGYKGGSANNIPSNSYQPSNSHGYDGRRGNTADATSETQTQVYHNSNSRPLTEAELLAELNEQGKATYQSLTPEGRALALTFANQGTPADKNEAVKLAAQRMSERRLGATRANGY